MKQLKMKAERRFFGKLDSSETEKMAADSGDSSDYNTCNSSSGSSSLHRTSGAVGGGSYDHEEDAASHPAASNQSTTFSTMLQSEREPHQRHESMCNLLDYEEHIMKRDMTRRQGMDDHDGNHDGDTDQLPVIALMLTTLRRSLLTCGTIEDEPGNNGMDISWPTNVRHVTHVTFDRFNGFLGLPVEFEVEIPKKAPSASANVFGVSPESMQCSYDARGNSVPTILLRMQDRLYSLGGLKAEGIFRINAENSHEEHVREQLNKGIVPFNIDPHCLAGLIKAWFRELPTGVLDTLTPEQVMQCHTEEQSVQLVKLLPPMQGALLDWAINLMADVAQEEGSNKMNARNVAMVFAPNMTQMADPLTALMHAVQVMNFLKTLILRALKDRQDVMLSSGPPTSAAGPRNDGNENMTIVQLHEMSNTSMATNTGAYEEYGNCGRSHSKQQANGGKGRGQRLVNRIDQHSERVEAW